MKAFICKHFLYIYFFYATNTFLHVKKKIAQWFVALPMAVERCHLPRDAISLGMPTPTWEGL